MSLYNEHQQRRKFTQEYEENHYSSQCDQLSTDDEANNDFYCTNSTPIKKMSIQYSTKTLQTYQFSPQFQVERNQSQNRPNKCPSMLSNTTLNIQESHELYPNTNYYQCLEKTFSNSDVLKQQFKANNQFKNNFNYNNNKNKNDSSLFPQNSQQEQFQLPPPFHPQQQQQQQQQTQNQQTQIQGTRSKNEGLRLIQQSNNPNEVKYKTQICENWIKKGYCNYGNKCKFAHGFEDKKKLLPIGSNQFYKTRRCNQFFTKNFCTYGFRCHFQHEVRIESEIQSQFMYQKYLNTFSEQNIQDLFNQEKDQQFQDQSFSDSTNDESSENLENNKDFIFYNYNKNLSSKLKRLPVFQDIEEKNQTQENLNNYQ